MSAKTVELRDNDVIQSFPRHPGPGEPGFITDFLGTKTRLSSIPAQFAQSVSYNHRL